MKQLLNEFGALPLAALQDATHGCLQGLRFLHSRPPAMVHGDVRSANLLISHADAKVASVKLTDYFRATSVSEPHVFNTLGSFPWAAPEVITQPDGGVRRP